MVADDEGRTHRKGRNCGILFLGDVVGRAGRDAVAAALPALRTRLRADLVIVNGENASHGFGLGPDMAQAMLRAGADVVTLGNHAWDRKELTLHRAGAAADPPA